MASSTKPSDVASTGNQSPAASALRYIDIGINLTDPVFHGVYHGKNAHESDFEDILQRAKDVGCQKFMITGSDLKESEHAIKLASEHPSVCYATVGVHPCSAKHFDEHKEGPTALLESLKKLAIDSKAAGYTVAFGEIGLDYDRLFLTPKDQQLKYFEAQLDIAVEVQLPLFLHSRAAAEDFERLLSSRLPQLPKKGLVHSFTGTMDEMKRLVELGLDVGVNGCSLKTDENIEVVREMPLERIQIETDGPWCEMRPSHASAKFIGDAPPLPKSVKKEKWAKGCMIKGRNEPCAIPRVAYAIANIKGISVDEVCEAAWNNSTRMFGLGQSQP
ncbi:Mg-dependent DNase [Venturia nashicola]|uniref:Mg-dependent DNase n=1 Tax=Venturia nashicola TaxID=86259 RepID=A0A4Z1NLX7_9PEZI|nr:Mg-dependent DNase [Venturia nashicola]TLD22677.1 Mg-dependent DNase [Venturia nashicola]